MKLLSTALLALISFNSLSQKVKPVLREKLPDYVKESSGVQIYDGLWMINDGDNSNKIYKIDNYSLIEGVVALFNPNAPYSVTISNAKNIDWEELAKDSTGNMYIGDFGNNLNRRKALMIYKFPITHFNEKDSTSAEVISFHYPDQKQFPPRPSNWNFDCEAFLHHGDSLYLFSKNLSNPNDGYTKMYRLPDETGDYKAELIDSIYLNEPVTSADISPDGKTIVLLTYFSIWVFKNFTGSNFFGGKIFQFPFRGFTQKEAVCFASDHDLLITDERHFGKGGKLYQIDLNQLDFSKPTKKFKSQFCKRAIYNLVNNPKAKYRKIMSREAAQ